MLVSQTTAHLVERELVDLGEHRLKDIERPERLYQLEAPGLRSGFGPPRAGRPNARDELGPRIDRYVQKQVDDALRSIDPEESDRKSARWRRLLGRRR